MDICAFNDNVRVIDLFCMQKAKCLVEKIYGQLSGSESDLKLCFK